MAMSTDNALINRPNAPVHTVELTKLNERSRTIFRQIVETYLDDGRAGRLAQLVARAADVAVAGLDPQRHVGPGAAGPDLWRRIPRRGACRPQLGLRLFVDGLLEVGDLTDEERRQIEAQIAGQARASSVEQCCARPAR